MIKLLLSSEYFQKLVNSFRPLVGAKYDLATTDELDMGDLYVNSRTGIVDKGHYDKTEFSDLPPKYDDIQR